MKPRGSQPRPKEREDMTTDERIEALAEAIIGNLSDLRSEINTRFEEVSRQFAGLERRLERTAETMHSIDLRMGALSKWADTYDRDNGAMLSNQAAQQRAIDQLAQRLTRLERQVNPAAQQ